MCGANAGSGLQCWRNLVEKVNAKKIEAVPRENRTEILPIQGWNYEECICHDDECGCEEVYGTRGP